MRRLTVLTRAHFSDVSARLRRETFASDPPQGRYESLSNQRGETNRICGAPPYRVPSRGGTDEWRRVASHATANDGGRGMRERFLHSPWDPRVLACPAGRRARSVQVRPSPPARRLLPESPVCPRVRVDLRLLADRVVPAVRVLPAHPVTSQERYVVTAFLSGESPRHKSVSRYSSVCATD